jgi:hypothetical protein
MGLGFTTDRNHIYLSKDAIDQKIGVKKKILKDSEFSCISLLT